MDSKKHLSRRSSDKPDFETKKAARIRNLGFLVSASAFPLAYFGLQFVEARNHGPIAVITVLFISAILFGSGIFRAVPAHRRLKMSLIK